MSDNIYKAIENVSLTDGEVADLKNHLSLMRHQLPFAVGLSLDERTNIPTISRTNKLFVEDIVDAVDAFPELLPGFIPETDWDAVWELYQQMEDLEVEANQLVDMFRHTKILAGAKIYKDAREVYQLLKVAYKRGMPGVGPFYERATRRFEGQRLSGNSTTVEPEEDENASDDGPMDQVA